MPVESYQEHLDKQPLPPQPQHPGNGLAETLAQYVLPHIQGQIKTELSEDKIKEVCESIIRDELAKADKPRTLQIELKAPSGEIKPLDGLSHFQFPDLLALVRLRIPVLLYGKPGSAKSFSGHQAAECEGLTFGLISLNPQTPESRLFGFRDASGTYHDTLFRQAFENGGVFMIDEIDNASDSLLTSLNSCLANGHGAFPDGLVNRHPDFVLVATANTHGHGGDINHAGRRPLDAATIDRFAVLHWEYDQALEVSLCDQINPLARGWVVWVQSVRQFCLTAHPRVVVSPRASMTGVTLFKETGWEPSKVAELVLFKGLEKDTKDKILSACPLPTVSRS